MIEIYKYKNKYKTDMAVLHVRFLFLYNKYRVL